MGGCYGGPMPRGERNRRCAPPRGLDRPSAAMWPSLHGSVFMILKDFPEGLWKILQDHGWGALRGLSGVGEGDLQGPLVGATHDGEFDGLALCRRERVEQVIGSGCRPARGRHDQVA